MVDAHYQSLRYLLRFSSQPAELHVLPVPIGAWLEARGMACVSAREHVADWPVAKADVA